MKILIVGGVAGGAAGGAGAAARLPYERRNYC
jgi:uncharacterized protein involved in exopolysaccharide biosynthesis